MTRVYTVEELRNVQPGTCFDHPIFGKGVVVKNGQGGRYMQWERENISPACFNVNSFPWNEPMVKL